MILTAILGICVIIEAATVRFIQRLDTLQWKPENSSVTMQQSQSLAKRDKEQNPSRFDVRTLQGLPTLILPYTNPKPAILLQINMEAERGPLQ